MGRCEKIEMPTSLVLLGGTGDLAQKKLIPALLDLTIRGVLPERFHVVGFSKHELDTAGYRGFVREQIARKGHQHDKEVIDRFVAQFSFVEGDFGDKASYEKIKQALEEYDSSIGMCTSKLFYLAVPPVFYDTIFEQLAHTRLDQPCIVGDGWTRILVEKPFGSDLDHAHYLEDKLSVLFREEQIYRIDHYLAKDALQNIIAFRFSNGLFENNWNREYVEAVSIKVFEQFDVSTRGAFFDGVGALRDVGQNHMLQMLALVAMQSPEALNADSLRGKRAQVLQSLKIPSEQDLEHNIVKGQYAGYRDTTDVDPNSNTETYFALKTYLDIPEWEGVPFYLEHGKALNESKTEITVRFRSSKDCVCGAQGPHDHPNFIRFTVSPEQKITVRFWVRKPGLKYELEPNDLVFDRSTSITDKTVLTDAYEEVLFDAICGDQTLFVSSDEQAAAWKYISSILKLWEQNEPLPYEPQSQGPTSTLADEMHQEMRLLH